MPSKGDKLNCRKTTECSQWHKQTSVLAGTFFTVAIYHYFSGSGHGFIGLGKGSISALRMSNLLEMN